MSFLLSILTPEAEMLPPEMFIFPRKVFPQRGREPVNIIRCPYADGTAAGIYPRTEAHEKPEKGFRTCGNPLVIRCAFRLPL